MSVTTATAWRQVGTYDRRKAEEYFRGGAYDDRTVGHILDAAEAYCGEVQFNCGCLLGQVATETGWFRFGGQVQPEQYNFAGIGATDGGPAGASFATPEEGVAGVLAHHGGYLFGSFDRWPVSWLWLQPLAIRHQQVMDAGYGASVAFVGDYGAGKWATDPDYAGKIVDRANQIGATDTGGWTGGEEVVAMGVPRPPIVDRLITKQSGQGVTWIAEDRVPKGTVLHSMVGTLWGTDGYFHQPTTQALTDFGIGQDDLGDGYAEILQWNDYRSKQVGWASGPVLHPEGDGPAALAANGPDPNIWGVSIERDDGANFEEATAAQWSAICWLIAYIHAEECGQTADTLQWQMQHYEFCGDAYKECPHWPIRDHTGEYQAAVRAIMRHCQEGVPYPSGGVWVNGRRLALPEPGGGDWLLQEDEVQVPERGTAVSYVAEDGQPVTVIAWDGTADTIDGTDFVDVGIVVTNAKGERYARSLQRGVMGEWRKLA